METRDDQCFRTKSKGRGVWTNTFFTHRQLLLWTLRRQMHAFSSRFMSHEALGVHLIQLGDLTPNMQPLQHHHHAFTETHQREGRED